MFLMKPSMLPPCWFGMACSVLALFACSESAWSEEMKRYKIASARIQYKLSGTQTGTEELTFDRYGMREARRTQSQISMAGQVIKTDQLSLMDGETTTMVDMIRKTATKMPTPLMGELTEAARLQGGDMSDLGAVYLERMGGVKTGTGTVAGKPCEVWELRKLGSKAWVWNGVTLRSETAMAGQTINIEAVSVEEAPQLGPDAFAVPPGVSVGTDDPMKKLREIREKMKGGKPPQP